MTRITVQVSNTHHVDVSIPYWLFKLIAGFMAIWVLYIAGSFLLEGNPLFAIITAAGGLAFIPVVLLFSYIYWRFFWWLTAVWMGCATAFTLPIWLALPQLGRSQLPSFSNIPPQNYLLFGGAVLVVAFVILWSGRSRSAPIAQPPVVNVNAPALVQFNAPAPAAQTFEDKVAALVAQQSGCTTAQEQDYLRVYRSRKLVGVVKCIDKPGKPISPIIVREAQKLGASLGVPTVYLATSGFFPKDAQDEANRLGVKTLEVI